jgi:hypothetical protein
LLPICGTKVPCCGRSNRFQSNSTQMAIVPTDQSAVGPSLAAVLMKTSGQRKEKRAITSRTLAKLEEYTFRSGDCQIEPLTHVWTLNGMALSPTLDHRADCFYQTQFLLCRRLAHNRFGASPNLLPSVQLHLTALTFFGSTKLLTDKVLAKESTSGRRTALRTDLIR